MQRYDSYKDSGIQWLGQIPRHWEVSKVRTHFTQRTDKVSELDFPPLSVSKQGIVPQLDDVAISQAEGNTRKLVRKGDFVVNSRSDRKGSCGVSPLDGSVSLINIVLEPQNIAHQYVHYLFRMNDWIEDFYRHGRGIVADLWTTNYQQMKNMLMPIPPLSEQEGIVTYLDKETQKIDTFISSKQKEIQLLNELKQAEIANAVTRGLHPNVPMKDSTIAWLGQVPEHWEMIRNKSFMRPTDEKVGDRRDEFVLLSLTKQGVIIRDLSERKGKFPTDYNTYLVVRPSNLVFCLFDIDETPRTVGLVENIGMLTGAYSNFEFYNDVVLPKFAYYYYLKVDDVKGLRPYYTGLRKVVKSNTFAQLRIPVPPLPEQKEIVEYLDRKCANIDKMISNIEQEITQLKEYKQRLIADAVTGQIKVC